MTEGENDLSKAEFTKRAIKQLRELPEKGIHSEYSGFNDAFRKYFNEDPKQAISRLKDQSEIATRDAEGGVKLYLPGEAPKKDPDETVDMIVASEEERAPDVSNLTGDAPPVVIDQEGPHETTEYALIPSEERFWLRNFREDGERVAVKSVYRSKEDLKSMDRARTEWKWDGDEKIWAINTNSLEYAIDHFLSNGYNVAVSPEITEYIVEEYGYSVDYIERSGEPSGSSEPTESEEVESYDAAEESDSTSGTKNKANRESEYMESPELEEITSEREVEDGNGHEGIEVNDVVEHSSGQRGKVVDKEDGTLIVSTGPDSRNEWSEGACEFIRKGR